MSNTPPLPPRLTSLLLAATAVGESAADSFITGECEPGFFNASERLRRAALRHAAWRLCRDDDARHKQARTAIEALSDGYDP